MRNSSKNIEVEEVKRIKTPIKRIFIESDRNNNKECLSEFTVYSSLRYWRI